MEKNDTDNEKRKKKEKETSCFFEQKNRVIYMFLIFHTNWKNFSSNEANSFLP